MIVALDDLIAATGAQLVGPSGGRWAASIRGVAIDSREIRPGELFVAVQGGRDGHDFVASAARLGATAAVVSRPVDAGIAQLVVPDTVAALATMGALARDRINGPTVGITGSVGKTSTKDLLAAVSARSGLTTASARSLNNELGVPLTLLNADELTERTIIEMGARGEGHIEALCRIARPHVGVVTSVAAAHTEMFGSVEAIAEAKGELIAALPADGTAVLNADDPRVAAMVGRTTARVLTFGLGTNAEVRGVDIILDDDLRPRFVAETPWGRAQIHLGVRGHHNVTNALAAIGAALVTGVSIDDVVAGLGLAVLSPSRMDLVRLDSGGVVLDDAYNANPASMRAALAALGSIDAARRVAVVGLMAELGDDAERLHREIASEAASAGIEVVAVGTDLYGDAVMATVGDIGELADVLAAPTEGEAVLLKASRIVGLDRVAQRWRRSDQPVQ